MEFKDTMSAAADEDLIEPPLVDADSSFRISARPVVSRTDAESPDAGASHLPRSYGTETLSLLARDPHTVFAFWDIDWNAAFRGLASKERKVHLRLLDSDGTEQTAVEVEPMAGSCYVTVADADAAYSGEIGYYHPATTFSLPRDFCLGHDAAGRVRDGRRSRFRHGSVSPEFSADRRSLAGHPTGERDLNRDVG